MVQHKNRTRGPHFLWMKRIGSIRRPFSSNSRNVVGRVSCLMERDQWNGAGYLEIRLGINGPL